jgi:hypothetical protein
MRLKSEIWVQAYLRICASHGTPAVLVRRGDADAGAIYVKINRLDGTVDLYGPAVAGLMGVETERRWSRCLGTGPVSEAEADRYVAGQARFDPDLWLVEVEDRRGRHWLEPWLSEL